MKTRKQKIEVIKGLMAGTISVKSLNEEAGKVNLREFSTYEDQPGCFFDKDGTRLTERGRADILTGDRELGIIPFEEIKSYKNKPL